MFTVITREVSPSIGRCELTHLNRKPIDIDLAVRQHQGYCSCLAALGCQVIVLPAEPDYPDSVFVEDVAIVLDEVAIITRPGAASGRGERSSIECALAPYRAIERIESPATLDGGDVLLIDHTLYVGLSSRSSESGIDALRSNVLPHGYKVKAVPVAGCLHLKSACTYIGRDTLLINREWVDQKPFANLDLLDVAAEEPDGANALLLGEALLYSMAYPRTRKLIEDLGVAVTAVNITELAKAEGAVTCSSLILMK